MKNKLKTVRVYLKKISLEKILGKSMFGNVTYFLLTKKIPYALMSTKQILFQVQLDPSIGHYYFFFKKGVIFLQANKFSGTLYQTMTFQLRFYFNIRNCSCFLASLLQKIVLQYYFCVIKY